MRRAKLLITGGAGFIGTNLVEKLHSVYDITVLDNFSSRTKNRELVSALAQVEDADVTNSEDCMRLTRGQDYVVHLAAKGSVVESMQDPIANLQANVLGTLNVLQAAAENHIKRLVFSSTGGALMGNTEPPVNESSLPKPISPYGASKMACEGYCSAYAESWGLPITVLRFGNVYGRHCQHKKGIMNKLLDCFSNSVPLTVYGDGTASRDFIHANDICAAIQLALTESPKQLNTYHVATATETSLKQLVDTFERVSKQSLNVEYANKRAGEVERNFSSYELANNELGYEPQVNLAQGLADMWDWYSRIDTRA